MLKKVLDIMKSEEYGILLDSGLIDEIAVRNLEIREKFCRRVREKTNLVRGDKRKIKDELANEYGIDRKLLSKILYSKKQYKKRMVLRESIKC